MTSLYSCRHEGDLYRITKLTSDLDVESSYLVGEGECQCPGFERRHTCRHLDMLPRFIARESRIPGALSGQWLHNFERNAWMRHPMAELFDLGDALRQANIPGVTVITLDDPAKLYNTIAEAVGEPTLPQPKPGAFKRRF